MLLFEVTMLHRLPSNQPQRSHKQLALRSVRICQQSVLSGLHGSSFGRVVLVGPVRFHPQCGSQYYPFGNEPRCYSGHKSYSVLSHRRYDCSVGQALKKWKRACYITRFAFLRLNKLLNDTTKKNQN